MKLEPVRELIALAAKLRDQIDGGDGAYPDESFEVCNRTLDSIPSLEALLALAEGVERLAETHGDTCKIGQFTRSINPDGSADEWPCTCLSSDLHSLLHPEDKQ